MTATRPLPRPVRRPAAPAPPRPALRLVPPPEELEARRRSRLAAVAVTVLVCAGLFAVVALRVLLTQGQASVDVAEESVAAERAEAQRLRARVAELESPARIVSEAVERLGMTWPDQVTPLAPLPPR